MLGILQGQVDGGTFVVILIALFITGYFIYKEWPDFKKRMSEKRSEALLDSRVTLVEKRLDEHQEMLQRDYKKLNALEDSVELNRQISTQTLEEMEILMRAMLGVLTSLEEMGADGQTKESQAEINDYLTKIAHKRPVRRKHEEA